jgi:addiction module RelE/StbE family toxin
MRVVVTAKAKADLLAIRSFIEAHNPELAVSFTEELLDRSEALADNNPRAYALVARYERFGIRRCVHGNYLIFYRLQQELIEVIRILQGARDMEALLFRSPN